MMLNSLKVNSKFLFSFFVISFFVLQSCSSSDDDDSNDMNPDVTVFDSGTLPGTYDITFVGEAGVHVYEFKANGTVDIDYSDGTQDTENWMVNDDGALVITGSVNDLFTLTSGDQSSGNMDVILRDEGVTEGGVNTTGTISKQ